MQYLWKNILDNIGIRIKANKLIEMWKCSTSVYELAEVGLDVILKLINQNAWQDPLGQYQIQTGQIWNTKISNNLGERKNYKN
jgi:hypothetical protein